VAASTVYGTVTLNSQNAFTIKPGAKAYATASAPALDPTYANFTALGFEAKTINAKSIGRLNFQVGPAANQLISIDLADFGKNGDITGPITSDRAPTNLLTVNSSNDVIMNVNKSLDRIAATRATMGAVMNRLEHVIDNLTNVVMNSEASRSQIEDADYAQGLYRVGPYANHAASSYSGVGSSQYFAANCAQVVAGLSFDLLVFT
jgi:flagellin